jgi:hypothetical protein
VSIFRKMPDIGLASYSIIPTPTTDGELVTRRVVDQEMVRT